MASTIVQHTMTAIAIRLILSSRNADGGEEDPATKTMISAERRFDSTDQFLCRGHRPVAKQRPLLRQTPEESRSMSDSEDNELRVQIRNRYQCRSLEKAAGRIPWSSGSEIMLWTTPENHKRISEAWHISIICSDIGPGWETEMVV